MKHLAFISLILVTIAFIAGCAEANDPIAPASDVLVKDMESGTVMGDFLDMSLTSDYVFVAEDNAGFSIWNRNDLTKISQNWHFESDFRLCKLICAVEEYNRVFIVNIEGSDGIYIFDYTDPANPTFVAANIGNTQHIEDIDFFVNTHEFSNQWDASSQIMGLRTLDNVARYAYYQTDPSDHWVASPAELEAELPFKVAGFDSDYQYIYVAGEQMGVYIVDKSTFTVVGQCDTPGEALTVKINGDALYVADRQDGLTVIDVTDRTNPVLLNSGYNTTGYAQELDVDGDWLAVASGGGGAYLFDISDPKNPQFADRMTTSQVGYTRRVDLFDGYLYVGSRDNGVVRLSIHP